jgi:hypothetical protein
MADLVPTAAHVPIPWVMGYDIAPGRTTIDKEEFYQFISQKNLVMIFEHDIKRWGARVQLAGHDAKVAQEFASTGQPSELLPL